MVAECTRAMKGDKMAMKRTLPTPILHKIASRSFGFMIDCEMVDTNLTTENRVKLSEMESAVIRIQEKIERRKALTPQEETFLMDLDETNRLLQGKMPAYPCMYAVANEKSFSEVDSERAEAIRKAYMPIKTMPEFSFNENTAYGGST